MPVEKSAVLLAYRLFDSAPILMGGYYDITITLVKNSYNESKVVKSSIKMTVLPTYSISLNPSTDITFNSAVIGYGNQALHTISVKNDGNAVTGDLTVSLSGTNADSFTLSKNAISSIVLADSDTFTIVPKTGLPIGTYTAAVTVAKAPGNSNDLTARQFNVSFTVTSADKPSEQDDLFLVTFLDSKSNTVKVEWVKYGGNATAPTGYGTYSGYTNVTAHMDLKPIGAASTSNGYSVPNTADKN